MGRRFITKAKYSDDKVYIEHNYTRDDGGLDLATLESKDTPHPDLVKAKDALVAVVLHMMGLPEDWADGLTVTGASFTENEKQGFGATVLALKRREEHFKGVLVLNMPHHYVGTAAMEGQPSILSEAHAILLRKFQIEAEQFLNGKRAQPDMFDHAMAAAGEKPEPDEAVVIEFARGKDIAETPKKEPKAKKGRVTKRRGVKGLVDDKEAEAA